MRAYFLCGHPFGEPSNPEEILEGPFATLEAAASALEAHDMNHGVPARVVLLAEAVEPVGFVCALSGTVVVYVKRDRNVGSLDEARAEAATYSYGATVYGLVPVGGS